MRFACCGLCRDSNGSWLKGYIQRIRDGDAWGMYMGTQVANREGFTPLIVESDSKLLINIVTRSCKLNKHTPILVHRIQDLTILHGNIALILSTPYTSDVLISWLVLVLLLCKNFGISS